MSLASLLSLPHADLLTALSYSPSSTHLVTASADHTLALFRRGANGSSWTKVDRWKAHDGPVGGVGWAQDEWGVMVGSWGWDRKVAIWREDVEEKRNSGRRMPLLWSTVLPPSVGLPSSLAFPPLALSNNAQGLLLACLTDRGYLVVWTPSGGGGGAGLNDWFELARCDLVRAATTISGDAPSSTPAAAAAGGQLGKMLGGTSSHLHSNANGNGSSSSSGGGGRPSPSSTTTTSGLVAPSTMTAGGGGAGAGKAVRRLSWCREAWWGLVFACALDSTGAIHIMTLQTPSSPPLLLVTLPSPSPFVTSAAGGAPPTGSSSTTTPYPSSSSKNVSSPTTTAAGAGGGGGAAGLATQLALDWAPSCGRSYHLIASGDRAGVIRIWRVVPAGLEADEDEEEEDDSDDDDDDDEGGEGGGGAGGRSKRRTARGEWTARCVAELADHGAPVTQLQWNATGTLLSSSADDGTTRLFKATYANRWECAAVFDAESPPPAAEDAGEGGDAEMA